MTHRIGLACALALLTLTGTPTAQNDPLAAEIARWTQTLASETSTDAIWLDAKKSAEPVLKQAADALRGGRRLVALERLAAARQQLDAARYLIGRPDAERKDQAALETEWKRVGAVMQDVLSPSGGAARSIGEIRPALTRALAELAVSQAREAYAASLDYGRNTEAQYGLYYLGSAQAQRGFAAFARTLPQSAAGQPPSLRPLQGEIAALQSSLLEAYRPPASIDRHPEFIVASSALKEARELDAAGHRHAALLRYLQAAQRTAAIRRPSTADAAAVTRELDALERRLAQGRVDHTLGRLFLERARAALADDSGPAGQATAAAVASEVLPRYFAALEPAKPAPAPQQARVTVTLVRWPFT